MNFKGIIGRTCFLLLLVATACGQEEKTPAEVTVTTKIALQSYRSATGAFISPVFNQGDQVRLVDITNGESDVKPPINMGGSQSSFLFSLKNAAAGDLLAAVFPSEASASFKEHSVSYTIPDKQDGKDLSIPMIGWASHSGDTYSGNSIRLDARMALVRAAVQKGSYSIQKAVLTANSGENLAGAVSLDMDKGTYAASASSVTVTLQTPLDCRREAQTVPFFVAPGSYKTGLTVTFHTDDGKQIVSKVTDPVSLGSGSVFSTDPASAGRQLVAAGGTKVYLFDEKLAREARDYKAGLIWEWDSSKEAGKLSRPDHIDDAKPVYDNKKMLVTSSFAWCALVDIETKNLEFYATGLTNAHSAEILPDGRIAVACAEGYVALYDKSNSNLRIADYPLTSAHGVVWSEKKQRLYAIGASSLQIYKLNDDWKTRPALVLEKTISSTGFVTGMHDMTAVDENTLIIGGNKLAFFDINAERFTGIQAYNGVAGFKSVNYNATTGEMYYTYAWENYSEGAYTWSSHWIRYTDNLQNSFSPTKDAQGIIRVEDINMYKVRVFSW